MNLLAKYKIKRNGASLFECLVTLLTMMIGLSGLMGYRYYSVSRLECAEDLAMAARTGHMIAEIWTGLKGDLNYDLSNYTFGDDFQIRAGSEASAEIPSDFIQNGCYDILYEGRTFKAVLAYQDSEEISNIRNLYVSLDWTTKSGQEQNYIVSAITQTGN